jgi:branched-chain amino acid transport system ATP-binding protein
VSFFTADDLGMNFGGIRAVDGVSFEVEQGQVFTVIGPNGAGKTTIFNLVSRIYDPSQGRLLFRDEDITRVPPHEIARRGIARTFQTVRLFPLMTVRDNVQPTTGEKASVERALEMAGLAAKGDVLAGELSVGEQRRLEIARALARSPRLVLMDEPTAGLNPEETDALVELIAAAVLPVAALILIEHKPDVVAALCPMAILLDRGRKVAEAPPAELFGGDAFRRAYLGVMDGSGGALPCG